MSNRLRALQRAVRAQRKGIRAHKRAERPFVLESAMIAAPEYARHPFLGQLVHHWWAEEAAGSLTRGWLSELPERIRRFYANAPWGDPAFSVDSTAEGECLSISKCRMALGMGRAVPDSDIAFIRDQMYAIAEAMIDKLPKATKSESMQ